MHVTSPCCDFVLLSQREVSAAIIGRAKAAEPFSLVRLGDGEGLLMSLHPATELVARFGDCHSLKEVERDIAHHR